MTPPTPTARRCGSKVRHITLPQLRGVLLVTFILQIIGTSQVFLEPFLFTGGGPANATMTVLLLIYKYAFQNSIGGDYGAATALSLMLAGVPCPALGGLLLADAPVERRVTSARLPVPRRRGRYRGRRRARGSGVDPVGHGAPTATDAAHHRRALRTDARVLPDRRPRATAVARQIGHHADPGHAAHAAGAVPAWRRPAEPGHGLEPKVRIEHYVLNTLTIAFGCLAGASSSSRRRPGTRCPCCGRATRGIVSGLVLATLFVPAVVLLVPLYLDDPRPTVPR